ncbi:hypothetical protein [Meiothermus hypogaeus]|uniref:Uncharacterized protein n=2 Tax=Meiothermus hypogaeus TaxID=884155 RepID=A0A511R2T8_9DEIN|nr:hypothetical protein [Meiothermus hypogaeus]RIH76688.1 hypothetical protein Mhypo_02368 [Meiothermus hypogaeus]GEM83915.1 hypothetical protein MHY01S_20810 [Meiothermus hypogaeus NBRC 106114]
MEASNPLEPNNPIPPSPPVETEASSGSEAFAPLESETPFEEIPSAPEAIIPFTGEEIVNGTAMMLALGLRFQTPEEVQAFTTTYRAGVVPMLPPAAVLDALKVGEALAEYGIGKNRMPGMGNLADLPPWLRLVVGGLVLAMSAYGGINAAKAARVGMADTAGDSAAATN